MSIEQEGCPSVGWEVSAKLSEQQWLKEYTAKKEAEKKAVSGATIQKTAAAPAGKTATSPAGRGGTQAGRGSSTTSKSVYRYMYFSIYHY